MEGRAMAKRSVAGFGLIVAALVLAGSFWGCSRSTPVWNNRGGPPRVVVTIPALDNFVRNVGGEHVAVICLCTVQGPHQYQYNAQDAMLLREADLFFAIGLTLDDKFADPIQTESHNAHLQYVKLGERLPKKLLLATREEHHHGKEEDDSGHDHEHEHGEHDPHVWLGIAQAKAMVEIIRDELKKADPNHAEVYETNYRKKLDELQAFGKEQLKDKKNRKIIAFHESLGYFAQSFGVDIVDAIEVTPGSEPRPEHMAKLAKECKEHQVRVIAVEPQYPKETSAEVLKKQVQGIAFAVVDPLETVDKKEDLKDDGKELKHPEWYEKKMRQNLKDLAKALP
jgi:zinc transport system substrate-binding protein